MLMGIRAINYGVSTLLINNGTISKIDAKFGYTSWHPSGKLAAYSSNSIPMYYHSARVEPRNTVDLNSLLSYYDVTGQLVKTAPGLSQKKRLETWPAWSADGRYLYFCSAERFWTDKDQISPDRYQEIKYDLVRISYDINKDSWGEVETVLSAEQTGLSIAMPHVSPDGRWLLFCMFDFGYFPSWQQESDLYLLNLEAAAHSGQYKYRRLEINSDQSEAWQSWSSNSRWIVFSSKRDYGMFTRTYFSYVDQAGRAHKAFVMPQKDPAFYDSCLNTYTVPELVVGPIGVTGKKLARVIRGSEEISVDIPVTMATAQAMPGSEAQWQQRE